MVLLEVPQGALASGETRVLVARPEQVPEREDWLSARERAARDRLRQAEDRVASAAARVLLRAAVGAALGLAPYAVELGRRCHACGGPHGAPLVVGADLQVSLSHTTGLVAVALHDGGPVGIDVEAVGPAFDDPGLRARLLSEQEAQRSWTRQELAQLWTAKEAVLKATGEGLTVDLRTVRPLADPVAVPPGFAAAVAAELDPQAYRST